MLKTSKCISDAVGCNPDTIHSQFCTSVRRVTGRKYFVNFHGMRSREFILNPSTFLQPQPTDCTCSVVSMSSTGPGGLRELSHRPDPVSASVRCIYRCVSQPLDCRRCRCLNLTGIEGKRTQVVPSSRQPRTWPLWMMVKWMEALHSLSRTVYKHPCFKFVLNVKAPLKFLTNADTISFSFFFLVYE